MAFLSQVLATALIKFGRLIVWFYYSPVRVIGRGNIPKTGPLLLVANHANSLIDPVLVGLTANRRVRFLAKAPLFDVPVFGKLLGWIGMIPVNRPQDDASKTKRSLLSLAKAAESLAEGSAIGIFPEGKSHDLRALTEVMSGTARMIQQAVEAGATNLQVVPIGINYDDKRLFRSAVWIEVGKPIDAAAIIAGATSNADARHSLTREIAARVRETIIHLDDQELQPFLGDLEVLDPALTSFGGEAIFSLQQRKSVADALNHFRKTKPEKVSSVGRALVVHRAHLQLHGLRVDSQIINTGGPRRLLELAWRTVRLAFGFIPVMCGVVQNIPPLVAERLIVRFLPQTGATTIALSRVGVAFPIFLLWYAFTWWLLAGYFLPWVTWVWVLVTPFAGLFALRYFRTFVAVARSWWAEIRMLRNRGALKELRAAQEKLRGRFSRLSEEYAEVRPPLPVREPKFYERAGFRSAVMTSLAVLGIGFIVVCSLRAGFRRDTLDALLRPAPDYSKVDTVALVESISEDERRLVNAIGGMTLLEQEVRAAKSEFEAGKLSFFNDVDNDLISRQMLTYLNCRQELLGLILSYRSQGTITDETLRLRASLISLTAGCTLYQRSSAFVSFFDNAPQARRKLNEGEPSWGIPDGLYDTVLANLKNERNLAPLRTALTEYRAAAARYDAAGLRAIEPQATFHQVIQQTTVAPPRYPGILAKLAIEADELRSLALYQGQSSISRAVGSTRVRERDEGPRITPGQLEKIRGLVRPGDILIERQDWFLSRAFMPGYWAHAALYIGTPEEVEGLGLANHEWVAPRWEEFKRLGAGGKLHAIIEAVPEGVRFTTLEHCLGIADSAAVLRPTQTTPEEIKDAIARAFRHVGKSYDFEFDFFSADKLVCTELVARAYSDSPHVSFPMVNVMGRQTLPPTEMARKFSTECHTPGRQLDLIIFLDGHAKGKQAVESGEAEFSTTPERLGMTWFNSLK